MSPGRSAAVRWNPAPSGSRRHKDRNSRCGRACDRRGRHPPRCPRGPRAGSSAMICGPGAESLAADRLAGDADPSVSVTTSIGRGQKVVAPFQATSRSRPRTMTIPSASAPPSSHVQGSPSARRSSGRIAAGPRCRAPFAESSASGCASGRVEHPRRSSFCLGSKRRRPAAEAQPDYFGQRVDDEGHGEECERRQEEHPEERAVAPLQAVPPRCLRTARAGR